MCAVACVAPAAAQEIGFVEEVGRPYLADRTIRLAPAVRARLTAWLDYRQTAWLRSVNPHLFIHVRNAITTRRVTHWWVRHQLGIAGQHIRLDRILDEAHATGGDIRRLMDMFGLSVETASRYTAAVISPHHRGDPDRLRHLPRTRPRAEDQRSTDQATATADFLPPRNVTIGGLAMSGFSYLRWGLGHAAVVGGGFRAVAVHAALRSRVVVDGRGWVPEVGPVVGEPSPAGRLINHLLGQFDDEDAVRAASSSR